MTKSKGKTIQIFLPDGNPRGIKIADITSRTVQVLLIPRSSLDEVAKRDEIQNVGIYFLIGTSEEGAKPIIYIGEAECIKDRIKNHLSKDFWNNVAFFITKDENLTKAHIRYIEGRLIETAKSVGRSIVMNSQASGAKLPESDREDMEIFLEKMQQVLPILGIEAFVQAASKPESQKENEMLTCKIKNVSASGYLTPNGIVVLKGSSAVFKERSSAKKWPSVMGQRNKLIEEGGLIPQGDKYIFVKDTEFSSPSAAAAVIHGGSANGLTAWVNAEGKSLKELESE